MSVRFRFKINTEGFDNLMPMYSNKWKDLLGTVFSVTRNRADYDRIAQLGQELPRDFTVKDIFDRLSYQNPHGVRHLSDCAPLFNKAPFDMKIFIVAMLGLQPIDD